MIRGFLYGRNNRKWQRRKSTVDPNTIYNKYGNMVEAVFMMAKKIIDQMARYFRYTIFESSNKQTSYIFLFRFIIDHHGLELLCSLCEKSSILRSIIYGEAAHIF